LVDVISAKQVPMPLQCELTRIKSTLRTSSFVVYDHTNCSLVHTQTDVKEKEGVSSEWVSVSSASEQKGFVLPFSL
jgi:hypothetical protein